MLLVVCQQNAPAQNTQKFEKYLDLNGFNSLLKRSSSPVGQTEVSFRYVNEVPLP